ncbi:MAG: hypothetical protein AABO41_27465 [Acidobacteriota bacterium]
MKNAETEEIDSLIDRLFSTQAGNTSYGPSPQAQQQVPTALLSIANRSADAKEKVIRALIKLLEDNADGGEDIAFYNACGLLGELRAVEAIDTLVKYIDYQPGHIGTSLNSKPAVKGLILIGEAAIPKIAEALMSHTSHLHPNDHLLLLNAIAALRNIGGAQAKQALETASSVEQDARSKEMMELAIQDIMRAGGSTSNVVVIKARKTDYM